MAVGFGDTPDCRAIAHDGMQGEPVCGANAIGEISWVTGAVNVARRNGVVLAAIASDPIYRGDIVTTGADAAAGLALDDGTVAQLSGNTELELTQHDCNASDPKAGRVRINLTRGEIAFVPGHTAGTGRFAINTPFAEVRSSAQRGGLLTLTLAAFTFALIDELRAAEEPTYLQYDTITYKDFQHGTFEIETKEPVPRIFVVDDPGVTFVLNPTGSGIEVQQVANSPAQMANLLAASQNAGATYSIGQQDPFVSQQQRADLQQQFIDSPAAGARATQTAAAAGSGTSASTADSATAAASPTAAKTASDTTITSTAATTPTTTPVTTPTPAPAAEPAPIAEPPVVHALKVTVPTITLTTLEDQSTSISGLHISDASEKQITVTLTATSTVTLNSTVGLTFTSGTGTADHSMTFSGSMTDVNAALASLTYTPSQEHFGTGHVHYTISDGNDTIEGDIAVNITDIPDNPVAQGDTLTAVNENSGTRIIPVATLLANDTDADNLAPATPNANLVVIAVDNAIGGTVELKADHVEFTPTPGFSGNASFDYTIDDGTGGTSTASATFTVSPVNIAPVLTGDLTATLAEGASYQITTADLSFTDPDDTAAGVSFTVTNQVNGTVKVNGVAQSSFTGTQLVNGQVSFTHDGSETSSASFKVSVEDGNEDGSTPTENTFNFTVSPVNIAPVLTGDLTATLAEGASYQITTADLSFTDPDDTAAGVSFTVTNQVNGTVKVNGVAQSSFTGTQLVNGQVSFTHDGSETSSASFKVSVEDGNEDGSTPTENTFNFTVSPVNIAPVLTGDLTATLAEGASYQITTADLSFTDPDDTAAGVSFTVTNQVNGTVKVNGVAQSSFTGTQLVNGQVSFTHDGSETSSASFKVSVEDGNEDGSTPTENTFNFTVSPVNIAPVLTGDLTATLAEGASYQITTADLSFTDPDDTAAGVSFTVTNQVNGTVKVNGVAQSSFTGTQLVNGQVSFTHDGSETSSASFKVSVEDGNEDGSTPTENTFNFTVSPVNIAPVLTGDLTATLAEGASYQITTADLSFTDPDDTAAGVSFTVTNQVNGTVKVNGVAQSSFTGTQLVNGQVSFTHDGSETSSASFKVSVEDGNEDGSTPTENTFNFTVSPVNIAPVLTGDLTATLAEGASYQITTADLSFTDPDDTAAGVSFTVTNQVNGTVKVNGVAQSSFTGTQLVNGQVSFTHDGSETSSASFKVSVEDGNEDGSTPTENTFNFTVSPVNIAPVLTGDLTATLAEGASYQITTADLSFTDPDDTAAGVSFTVTNQVNGTVKVNGVAQSSFTGTQLVNGQVSFTHDGSETSSASFKVSVEDGNEDGSTPTENTFNFTVSPVNIAPVLTGDLTATLAEGASYQITTADLSFTDPDDTAAGVSFTVTNQVNGTVKVNGVAQSSFTGTQLVNGQVSFTHDGSETSSASFKVSVEDGNEDGSTPTENTFNFTVSPVNIAPVLTGDLTATLAEGASYQITTADLSFTDPDDTAAGVSFTVTNQVNGTVKVNGVAQSSFTGTQLVNGQVSFTHDGSETSSASFKVSVEDGNEDGSTPTENTFNFTVSPVNIAPVLTGDLTATLAEGASYQITTADLSFTDPDDTAAGVSFTVTNQVNGTVKVNGVAQSSFTGTQLVNGQVSFTHDGSETSSASFKVSVEDGNEDGSTPTENTFNFTVSPVNIAPVLTGDLTATLAEGASYQITTADLSFTDPDDTAAGVSFTVTNQVNGTVKVNGVAQSSFTGTQLVNGQVSFTHDGSETSSASFKVSVEDGNEDGSTPTENTFNFTVSPVNIAPVLTGDLTATLAEGASYQITTADLSFTDPDDTAAGVSFTVTNQVNGTVKVNGVAQSSFTGTQLVNGQVSFTHDGSETSSASFKVSVEDGNEDGSTPTENTFNFTVSPVNIAPVLTGDLTATLAEGASYQITTADLSFTDPDDTAAGVSFTVTNQVNGTVKVNGVAQSSFTGTQLVNGQVSFTHDGSETSSASFKVSVEDGNEDGSTPTENTFNFTVSPVNDAPAGTDNTITTQENTAYTFSAANFGFSDPNDNPANTLLAVKITTLPAAGILTDNGNAVTPGQLISIADINNGLLKFTPATNATGSNYASFTFQVEDSGGTLNGGVDLDPSPNTMTINVTADQAPVLSNVAPNASYTSPRPRQRCHRG